MKKCVILLAISFFLFGKSYSQNCVVSTQDGNVVYTGVDNLLLVAVNGYACNDYYLITDNGDIVKGETACDYLIKPKRVGIANIFIYLKKTNRKLCNLKCRVIEIPPAVAFVGAIHGGRIKKTDLEVQVGIEARLPTTTLQTNFKVSNYTITIYRDRNTIYSKAFYGNVFPKELIKMVRKLKVSDRVLFSNMNYVSHDGILRPLSPAEFLIE